MTEKKKKKRIADEGYELGLLDGWVKYFPYIFGVVLMFYLFFPGIFR